MNVPVLAGAPQGWKVYLVDSPGLGENDATVTRVAETSLKSSSAWVYVLNVEALGDVTDHHYFAEMKKEDPGMCVLLGGEILCAGIRPVWMSC